MPKYLLTASYTPEGLQGLLKDGGTARREAFTAALASVGGTLESMYYAFGQNDLYIVVDMPDRVSMASISLAICATGAVTGNTTVLLTPEEIDQAVQKSINYRPPGA